MFVKNLTSGGAEKQAVLLAKALAGEYNMHYVIFNGSKVHQKCYRYPGHSDRLRSCLPAVLHVRARPYNK